VCVCVCVCVEFVELLFVVTDSVVFESFMCIFLIKFICLHHIFIFRILTIRA
jgi:hypothetical protein